MDLCQVCERDLPWIGHACTRCGVPLTSASQSLCGHCLIAPMPFHLTVVPLRYEAPLPQMIHQFKYRRRLTPGRVLAAVLAQAVDRRYANATLPEVIVPVPLAWPRLLWRGYNQAGLLATWTGKALKLPVAHSLVRRKRGPPPQTGLDAEARRRNLRGAFSLADARLPASVAVVDDVMTTGSTLRELARVLGEGGATEIHCWALARTDTPGTA